MSYRQATNLPRFDPVSIFEVFRGSYGSELLTAAVAHFRVFARLAEKPQTLSQLREQLQLAQRPAIVLTTALKAFGLLVQDVHQRLHLTDFALEHLAPGAEFDVSDYLGLAAESPGVLEMVERLRTNRPAGMAESGGGAAFIYREGLESAMEREASARHLTLALAGRAKNVAPVLAKKVKLDRARRVLDVGGGTGIYSIALLQRNPHLTAVVLDRPEVLKVADEMALQYGVRDRLQCVPGDMFEDALDHQADVVLLSNLLHDWDVPECRTLVRRCADALPAGGRLLIHDVFLHDQLDGPLPIALYSAALFTLTQGRAYSGGEYRAWMSQANLQSVEIVPTLIHCGVLSGSKPKS